MGERRRRQGGLCKPCATSARAGFGQEPLRGKAEEAKCRYDSAEGWTWCGHPSPAPAGVLIPPMSRGGTATSGWISFTTRPLPPASPPNMTSLVVGQGVGAHRAVRAVAHRPHGRPPGRLQPPTNGIYWHQGGGSSRGVAAVAGRRARPARRDYPVRRRRADRVDGSGGARGPHKPHGQCQRRGHRRSADRGG